MIREALISEVRAVSTFMTKFEECTKFVKVDIDHATKVYKKLITDNMGAMIILTDESGSIDKMVGGLGCVKGPDLHYPRITAVETFWYVTPEHRGSGLKLIKAFEAWAKRNNCDACAMIHLADSFENRLPNLYNRLDYELVEQHFVKEF
jgi:GNAT superfamily N-acetyltransferase